MKFIKCNFRISGEEFYINVANIDLISCDGGKFVSFRLSNGSIIETRNTIGELENNYIVL